MTVFFIEKVYRFSNKLASYAADDAVTCSQGLHFPMNQLGRISLTLTNEEPTSSSSIKLTLVMITTLENRKRKDSLESSGQGCVFAGHPENT